LTNAACAVCLSKRCLGKEKIAKGVRVADKNAKERRFLTAMRHNTVFLLNKASFAFNKQ